MLNLLKENKNQIQELKEIVKKYEGKTIVIASLIKDRIENSFKSQLFNKVDVVITESGVCFKGTEDAEDVNDIFNIIEFSFDNMKDTYIDILDIFTDTEPEVHVMFNYKEKRYSILNLV